MTLKSDLNDGNLSRLGAMVQAAALGDAVACIPRTIMAGTVNTANDRLELAEDRKAVAILSAYDITNGTAMEIEHLIGTTPAAGEIGVTADGDIVCAAADNIEAVDVVYVSPDADVVEFASVPVAASALVLPSSARALLITEVEILTGVDLQVMGRGDIVARGGAPADNQCCLNAAGNGVTFNAADVVAGTARVRAMVQRSSNLSTKLALTSGF